MLDEQGHCAARSLQHRDIDNQLRFSRSYRRLALWVMGTRIVFWLFQVYPKIGPCIRILSVFVISYIFLKYSPSVAHHHYTLFSAICDRLYVRLKEVLIKLGCGQVM